MKFAAGYAVLDSGAFVCSYDNKTCYDGKAVPSISSIDQNTGYSNGGHFLTIRGNGLKGTIVDVKVDGVPCSVQNANYFQIKCSTGPQPNPSKNSYYIGS